MQQSLPSVRTHSIACFVCTSYFKSTFHQARLLLTKCFDVSESLIRKSCRAPVRKEIAAELLLFFLKLCSHRCVSVCSCRLSVECGVLHEVPLEEGGGGDEADVRHGGEHHR